MKKIILLALTIFSLTFNNAKASITDSIYFDPALACGLIGGGAYLSSSSNEALIGGAACAVSALAVYLIQERGRNTQRNDYEEKYKDLQNALKEVEVMQAMKASQGDDESYSIKVRSVVQGYKDSKGAVIAPTIKEELILPGEGIRVGE